MIGVLHESAVKCSSGHQKSRTNSKIDFLKIFVPGADRDSDIDLRFQCLRGLCGAAERAITWCEALSSVSLVSGGPPGTNLRNPAYLWFWGSFEVENYIFIWISGQVSNTFWYDSSSPRECSQMFKWTSKIKNELKNWFSQDLRSRI